MKPNADMITKILHNFRVNGKFDQDRLIIGCGVDEQLQLMITDTIGIRYVPNNGSNPKLEYTNDGNTWHGFGEQGTVDLTYEPIEFDQSYLSSDGKITIQHDFNDKNVLCLGYTPQPKEIEYLDNQLVLDYSDQNGSNFSGAVWFVNSKQDMLSTDHTGPVVNPIKAYVPPQTSVAQFAGPIVIINNLDTPMSGGHSTGNLELTIYVQTPSAAVTNTGPIVNINNLTAVNEG